MPGPDNDVKSTEKGSLQPHQHHHTYDRLYPQNPTIHMVYFKILCLAEESKCINITWLVWLSNGWYGCSSGGHSWPL